MPIYRHVVLGPQAAGDQWTSGLHSDQDDANISNAHDAWIAAIEALFDPDALASILPASTAVREVITYALDSATGRATGVRRASVSLNGAVAAAAQPSPRDCIVAGLRTAVPGAGGRGRMYLPAPTLASLTATGLISDAARATAAGAVSLGLNALIAGGMRPGLFKVGAGAVVPFVSATVGQVLGTQRRRTNKIPNAYATATI